MPRMPIIPAAAVLAGWLAIAAAPALSAADALAGAAPGGVVVESAPGSAWSTALRTAPGLFPAAGPATVRARVLVERIEAGARLRLAVRDPGAVAADPAAEITAPGMLGAVPVLLRVPAAGPGTVVEVQAQGGLRAVVEAMTVDPGLGGIAAPLAGTASGGIAPAIPRGAEDFAIALPRPSATAMVSVLDHGAGPALDDNTAAFEAAIAACRATGARGVLIPAGTYRFAADRPLAFEGLSDVEVDGQGSLLVFRKAAGACLAVRRCERMRIADLAIDWDWERDPLASVVEVVAAEDGRVDLRFVSHRTFPRRDVRVADLQQLDPRTGTVGCEDAVNASFEMRRGRSPAPRTEWLDGSTLRLWPGQAQRGLIARLVPGQRFRMRHYVYDMNGIEMDSNAHLTLERVTVLSAPGHAFLTTGDQHHWQFIDTHVRPPHAGARPITCTADHHHIERSRGFFRMDGCEFGWGGDDCLNVHDTSAFLRWTGPRTLESVGLRGVESYHPGDPVELRQADLSPAHDGLAIAAIAAVDRGRGIHAFTLDRDVPTPAGPGYVLFNHRYGSRQIIVRNCVFRDNRARALLLLGRDVTVEGCRFVHNQMGAIKLETGYTMASWSEGFGVSNVVIRGNRFEQANPMGSYPADLRPAIWIGSYLGTDPSHERTAYPVIRDVLIEGNLFQDHPGALVSITSAANVVIRGNRSEHRLPRRREEPYRGWIGVSRAERILIQDNVWAASPLVPAPSVLIDPATTGAVAWSGNRIE